MSSLFTPTLLNSHSHSNPNTNTKKQDKKKSEIRAKLTEIGTVRKNGEHQRGPSAVEVTSSDSEAHGGPTEG